MVDYLPDTDVMPIHGLFKSPIAVEFYLQFTYFFCAASIVGIVAQQMTVIQSAPAFATLLATVPPASAHFVSATSFYLGTYCEYSESLFVLPVSKELCPLQ